MGWGTGGLDQRVFETGRLLNRAHARGANFSGPLLTPPQRTAPQSQSTADAHLARQVHTSTWLCNSRPCLACGLSTAHSRLRRPQEQAARGEHSYLAGEPIPRAVGSLASYKVVFMRQDGHGCVLQTTVLRLVNNLQGGKGPAALPPGQESPTSGWTQRPRYTQSITASDPRNGQESRRARMQEW